MLYAVLGVVGVLVIAGIVVTAVLLARGDDSEDAAGREGSSQSDGPLGGTGSEEPGEPDGSSQPSEPSDPDTDGDPSAAVEEYFDATLSGDCTAADALATENFIGEFGRCVPPSDEDSELLDEVDLQVGDADVSGEEATVAVSVDGADASFDIGLVYEDGEWFLDSVDLPGLSSPERPSGSPS